MTDRSPCRRARSGGPTARSAHDARRGVAADVSSTLDRGVVVHLTTAEYRVLLAVASLRLTGRGFDDRDVAAMVYGLNREDVTRQHRAWAVSSLRGLARKGVLR